MPSETPRCLGLLLGVEQAVMPLFDLSAFALSMLVFSGRRDLKAYVVSQADRALNLFHRLDSLN